MNNIVHWNPNEHDDTRWLNDAKGPVEGVDRE